MGVGGGLWAGARRRLDDREVGGKEGFGGDEESSLSTRKLILCLILASELEEEISAAQDWSWTQICNLSGLIKGLGTFDWKAFVTYVG